MRWQDVPKIDHRGRVVRNPKRKHHAKRHRSREVDTGQHYGSKLARQELRAFWQDVRDGVNRLRLLQEMAEVVVPFIAGWPVLRRRAEYIYRYRSELKPRTRCFVCPNVATGQHHVILLKHGGTNGPHNRVPICPRCHESIHDWMEPTATVAAINAEMALEDQHWREMAGKVFGS